MSWRAEARKVFGLPNAALKSRSYTDCLPGRGMSPDVP